ncbi:hypothetical protein [Hellea balneolensis]|uniref:hypothetical protein n=1 Tax=Hellea balneolensis TaxID=287478 RepID=UPI00047DABF8|nr:hypothetical protein [Hellea balneolensis]
MVLNPLIMGKLRQGVIAVAAGLALAGCNEANAEDNSKAEIQKVAAVVETADQVKARCRALSSETEVQKDVKRACYTELKAMRQAEITALDRGLEQDSETIDQKEADNENKRTIVKVLSEVRDEAFSEDPIR